MHNLPRQLNADELAALFEGRTRFVERLAAVTNPLAEARTLLRSLPEEEVIEALAAHPRIGERAASHASASEQGSDEDPDVLADLASLNRAYEEKFGFRFVVFVKRRSRAVIVEVLRRRLKRTREEELAAAIDELVAIAEDRWLHGVTTQRSTPGTR